MILNTKKAFRPGRLAFSIIATFALVFSIIAPATQQADALSGSDFNPGRIIDDEVFYNNQSMTAQQIQNFLNSKLPNCDTNGTGIASEWGSNLTRAQYAASRGWHAPPYTCLKDYRQNTPQMPAASGYCEGIPAGTNKTAAEIIYDIAQACKINPQVLIVLLEKEQSLVTDIWPLQVQYNTATGFDCPDNVPCDPAYAGFYYQLYSAARQFKVYQARPLDYNYIAGRNNNVYYHPAICKTWSGSTCTQWNVRPGMNPSLPDIGYCGSSQVYIQNQATAALYIYTPFQPNAVALSNIYGGQDDGCSSYGNRNFWRLFNDWFGRSTLECRSNEFPHYGAMRLYNPTTYQHFYTAYHCEVDTLTKRGWRNEGILHYQTSGSSPYAVVVHRLYNPQTQLHLWSTTQEDINNATQNAGYRYEGVAFYAVKPSVPGHQVVHRLYNPTTYKHLWSTTQEDINNATQNAGYRYEGVAYYGAPPPAN